MKRVIYIGAFREIEENSAYPSIRESLSSTPHPDKSRILRYLNNGHLHFASSGYHDDVINPTNIEFIPNQSRTDGVYGWSDAAIYYVDKYNLILPDEFIQHMKKNNWEVPSDIDESVFE